jgi:hypothetical protein
MVYGFIRIASESLMPGTAGSVYHEEIPVQNEQGTVSYSLVDGSLPPGLTLGSLSGTPSEAGTFTFTVRATDNNGAIGSYFDDRTFTVTINSPTEAPSGGRRTNPGTSLTPTPSLNISPSVMPRASSIPTPVPEFTLLPLVSPLPGTTPTPSQVAILPVSSVLPVPEFTLLPFASPTTPVVAVVIPEIGEEQTPSLRTVVSTVVHVVLPATTSVLTMALALPVAMSGVASAMASGSMLAFGLFNVKHALEIVGLKRHPRIWGVIYDSKTKRPLSYAKIELKDQNNRILETRFADRDGRYGFLTSPSSLHEKALQLSMTVSAPEYAFPSKLITSDTDFIVYDHIYKGGLLTTSGTLVNYNIPLDPQAAITTSVISQPLLSRSLTSILDFGFWLGLVATPLNAFLSPSVFSFSVLVIFLLTNLLRLSLNLYRPFGLVYNADTHQPLPYALITLNDDKGVRRSFAVSDQFGRYFLLSDPGTYDLTAFTPAQVQPQRSKTLRFTTRKGWLRGQVQV